MLCRSTEANKKEVEETQKQEKSERESKRYEGKREKSVVFIIPVESESPGSIVGRLEARAGLPLGAPCCSVAWAIRFFSLQQRIIFSCSTAMSLFKKAMSSLHYRQHEPHAPATPQDSAGQGADHIY